MIICPILSAAFVMLQHYYNINTDFLAFMNSQFHHSAMFYLPSCKRPGITPKSHDTLIKIIFTINPRN